MNLQPLPVTHRAVIPEDYMDQMGHMNVMWYTHLFSCAMGGLFERLGMSRDYFVQHRAGTFALEMHIRYHKEVRVGQAVTVHSRILGRSAKLFHAMHFMVHDEGQLLASTAEFVSAHIDMQVRRTSPWPELVARHLDALLAEHSRLDWAAPVCGAMQV